MHTILFGTETIGWTCDSVTPPELKHYTVVATVRAADGSSISLGSGLSALNGTVEWNTSAAEDRSYELHAAFYNGTYLAGEIRRTVTVVNHGTFSWHEGTIQDEETWTSATVHVVKKALSIAAGGGVTVTEGAIVKFEDGASIDVESGGYLHGVGSPDANVIFTPIEDDTAGGDTNQDGNASQPQYGAYSLKGAGEITLNYHVDLRYVTRTHGGPLAGNEVWIGQAVHEISSDITVPSGATLTILPGAIVKFTKGTQLTVESGGSLMAEGSPVLPIALTSIRDDDHGGDTNSDGEATTPIAGDWLGVSINGTATFSHVLISYAQGLESAIAGTYASFAVDGGAATLDACDLAHGVQDGVAIGYGGGTLTLQNSTVSGFRRGAFIRSGKASFINCVVDDCMYAIDNHGGEAVIVNSALTNYTLLGVGDDGSPVSVSYSDVYSASGTAYSGISDQTGTKANLSVDPMYRDQAAGDYRLLTGSPLIDAGDGAVASSTDRLNVPRLDDPHVTDRGEANGDGICPDIGAYEFADAAQSEIDLVAVSVSGPASATVGDDIGVTWNITNAGTKSASGPWRDEIALTGVSDRVAEIRQLLGEFIIDGSLAPGNSTVFQSTFTVPAMKDGQWRLQASINNHRDIFEGIYSSNNEANALTTMTVHVPEVAIGSSLTGTVPARRAWSAAKFEQAAGEDAVVHLATGSAACALYAGYGTMPSSAVHDVVGASSGAGDVELYLPVNSEARTVYFYVDGKPSGMADMAFTLSATAGALRLFSLDVAAGSNGGGAFVIPFHGARFSDGMTFALRRSGGSDMAAASSVTVTDDGSAWCQIDLAGLSAGPYDAVVGLDGTEAVLPSCFTVTATAKGASLEARLIAPEAVRADRQYTLWIEYSNAGDAPMLAPVFIVTSPTDTPMADTSGGTYTDEDIQVMGIGSRAPAGYLKPGESGRIPIYFKANGPSDFWLSPVSSSNESVRTEYWRTWNEYHAAMATAATRLNLRGRAQWRMSVIYPFECQYRAGGNVAAISGQLRSALTNEPIAGMDIDAMAVASSGGSDVDSTGPDGHFQLEDLSGSGNFTIDMTDACSISPSLEEMENWQDRNGCIVYALPYGRIDGTITDKTTGAGLAGVVVTAIGDDDKGSISRAVTGSDGTYEIARLKEDAYAVEVSADDEANHVAASAIAVPVRCGKTTPELDFALATGGAIGGTVTATATGNPVTSATITAADRDGNRFYATTDASGNHVIHGLPAHDYGVHAFIETMSDTNLTTATVNERHTATVNFQLDAGASVAGTVTAADGTTTSGIYVCVATANFSQCRSTFTESDGRYLIQGLKPGDYKVLAMDLASSPTTSISVSSAAQALTGISLKLENNSASDPSMAAAMAMARTFSLRYRTADTTDEDVSFAANLIGNPATWGIWKALNNPESWPQRAQPSGSQNCKANWTIYDKWMSQYVKAKAYYYLIDSNRCMFQVCCLRIATYLDILVLQSCISGHIAVIGIANPTAGIIVSALYTFENVANDIILHHEFDSLSTAKFFLLDGTALALAKKGFETAAARLGMASAAIDVAREAIDRFPGALDNVSNMQRLSTQTADTLHSFRLASFATEVAYEMPYTACPSDLPTPAPSGYVTTHVPAVMPTDPNEKVGPVGSGNSTTERFVLPGQEMTYTIYFENKSAATASAQEIFVSDQLDSKFDWSTFKLGEVVFDNQTVTDLAGQSSGVVEVTQTSSTLKVRVHAGVNTATGVVTWYLRCVDPSTSDGWPTDPYDGFLQPNDATHRGEGHVTFTVNAKSELASGVKITNTSNIIFDTNDAIATNEVFNTVSDGKPGRATDPSPANGSTAALLGTTLSWSAVNLATSYNVYFWADGSSTPETPTEYGRISAFYKPAALAESVTYHWRVDAINENGVTVGETWTFGVSAVPVDGDKNSTGAWTDYH